MKFKVKRDRNSGGRVLMLEGDRGDELDYVDAERVQRGDLEAFLPFIYEKGKRDYSFTYYLGSCISLDEMLRKPLAPMQLRALLTSLLHMVRQCENADLSRLHVAFNSEHVFFDPDVRALRFVYVPLRSYTSPIGEVAMLAHVCETAELPDYDRNLGLAVLDYARRTTVLTSVAFEDFLRGQGLYAASDDPAETLFANSHVTDALDTRAAHGWDFVRQAQQEQQRQKARGDQRFLVVRLADKSSYSLGNGAYTMGRADECAITLPDAKGVSRRHARISVKGNFCAIEDLKSTNGVFVNGTRVSLDQPVAMRPGDRFALGREEFELL